TVSSCTAKSWASRARAQAIPPPASFQPERSLSGRRKDHTASTQPVKPV
ncbi:hypothetical protein BCGKFG_BCGKFG_06830, partial [Dysosmobacter welbionis]